MTFVSKQRRVEKASMQSWKNDAVLLEIYVYRYTRQEYKSRDDIVS